MSFIVLADVFLHLRHTELKRLTTQQQREKLQKYAEKQQQNDQDY